MWTATTSYFLMGARGGGVQCRSAVWFGSLIEHKIEGSNYRGTEFYFFGVLRTSV